MNIVLITTLYPGYKGQSRMEIPYAVHYFAREWSKENNVTVFRLWNYYPRIYNLTHVGKKANKYNYKDNFEIDNVNIWRIPFFKVPKLVYNEKVINSVANNIIDILKDKETPDLIICDIINPSIYVGEILSRSYNADLVASLHNTDIRYLKNKKNREKFTRVEKNISNIVLRSNGVEKEFNKVFKDKHIRKKTSKILFGIDKNEIVNDDTIRYKSKKETKSIVVAASLIKLKNIDTLIHAFSNINRKNSERLTLKIIGDGVEKANLEKLALQLGVSKSIIFYGEKSRAEVLELMEESDVFAMVSSPETFGLVYIEAMAKGCITIGSRGEGIDGVIKNNKNGYLCSPRNSNELTELLYYVLSLDIEKKYSILSEGMSTAKSLTNEKLSKIYLNQIMEKTRGF